jgi:orotate phosphoribosyltransferase
MNEQQIFEQFEKIGVLKKGHFRLSSGKHSDTYLQCAILQQFPKLHAEALQTLADKIKSFKPTVIVGAAIGGIISAYELARLCDIRCIFAERVDGTLTFRRGYELMPQDRPILIEDVITTAKTTLELIDLVTSRHVEPLAVTCIVDRQSKESKQLTYPFFPLVHLEAVLYNEEDCPLCKNHQPLDEPGSRRLSSKR